MDELTVVRVHFKFDGGYASSGSLDIYDAAIALRGISRSLTVITHAFLNDGEVRHRASSARGARILAHPPTRGSYDQLVSILLSADALTDIARGVAGGALWEIIKWSYGSVLGRDDRPESPAGKRIAERIEPTFGDLSEVLESAVRDMHKPIEDDPQVTMAVIRPRVGTVLTFDSETLRYISETITSADELLISGNVTRYNVLSGWGRLYDDSLKQTVSFHLGPNFRTDKRNLLTESLDMTQRGEGGKLLFVVNETRDYRGGIKQYVVNDAKKQNAS